MADHDEREFAAPVLHGRRFLEHAVPLDVLKELETYQRLILEVAKAVFLGRHPQRRRVPRGFEARLKLSLRQVRPGSAQPVLLRSVERPSIGETAFLLDEFEEARDMVTGAVRAANDGNPLPKGFPRSVLGRFNLFGRSLRPDESIELRTRDSEAGPKYDHSVRKKLVLMEERSFSDHVDLVGRICEADVEKGLFHVLVDEQRIVGSFSKVHEDVILSGLKNHERARVRVIGTGRFDAQDRLERIDELDDIAVVEEGQLAPADLDGRTHELLALKEGWFDGEQGPVLDAEGLKRASELLHELYEQEDLPIPYLYPTPEGGVRAEWTAGSWELSAIIDLTTGQADLDAVDAETGADKEVQVAFFTEEGRQELVRFVGSFERKGKP